MTERPILFSGEMVRAILSGRKNQTRRIVKPQPDRVWRSRLYGSAHFDGMPHWDIGGLRLRECADNPLRCPYGQPGDRLWVRETWHTDTRDLAYARAQHEDVMSSSPICYRADPIHHNAGCVWRPSIHMPRWASRITLEIVSTRAEWLNDISEADAMAEGCQPQWEPGCSGRLMEAIGGFSHRPAASAFANLWESINGDGSWEANPLVWRIEFRRV